MRNEAMKNGRLKSFTLVVLIALLLAGGHSALAFVAPVQDVTTSLVTQGSQDVFTFTVRDPTSQQNVVQSVSYDSIKFPTTNEGIVAFIGVTSGVCYLNCWVFNPVTHQWAGDIWEVGSENNIGNLALGDVVQVRLPSTTAPWLLLLLD
jgi:hypothetical protein